MSAGAKFSSEDVTLLYRRVFHAPSSSDEAHAAMQKVTKKDLINKHQYRSSYCPIKSSLVIVEHDNVQHLSLFQIAGGDTSWSCVGENVIDVLLEMERERQKMEKVVK